MVTGFPHLPHVLGDLVVNSCALQIEGLLLFYYYFF